MTMPSFGNTSGADRMSPVPCISRGRGSRQTGTSALVARAASRTGVSSSPRPFACARRRSAAAASDEPPPSPAPAGRRLVSVKRPSLRPSMRAASACAARSTRLSASGPAPDAVGPVTVRPSCGPTRKASRSPNGANTTRLSRSWKPSGRRPRIRSVRLTLAGASVVKTPARRIKSSAAASPLLSLVGLGRVLLQADLELLVDPRQFIGLGLEIARMRPLELGLQHTVDPPVDVAQVIVDGRIDRLELDRALEMLHRLLVIAEPVIGPAERIDDVAVIGPLLDRALDHGHGFVEVKALVDP